MRHACCWCGSSFAKIDEHYWCSNAACRQRQAAWAITIRDSPDGDPDNTRYRYLYVPLPRQVEYESCTARYLLAGGAAGSTKSHACRWSLYRRALTVRNYEGLLLRRTWDELNKHHFRLMERDQHVFRSYGLDVRFSITNREMRFNDTGAVIEGGHMESRDDVDKYLSRERDDIAVDEGSTFEPQELLELSTRARSSKSEVMKAGGARFRIYTNPGGPASSTLRDFFIDHSPDWEKFSPALREKYNPDDWVYISGSLEDNPYLPPTYENDLAVLSPWRYQQLRHNDWNVVSGIFFTEYADSSHVRDLGDPGDSVEWFRSMDWGYVQPGCVLWWACLPDGIYYIRHELKFSHAAVDTVVREVLDQTATLGVSESNVRYTVADPALSGPNVAATRHGRLIGETMAETFAVAGLPLVLGDNSRVLGWQRVRELLRLRPDGRPWLIIHPSCRYLRRSISSATSAPYDPEDVNTHIDDHPIDALRYGAMSRPSPTRLPSIKASNSFNSHRARIIEARRRFAVR